MIKQIPVTLVLAAIALVFAEWPAVQTWADASSVHHYLTHLLYLLAGSLVGWQTSEWASSPASLPSNEVRVSSS